MRILVVFMTMLALAGCAISDQMTVGKDFNASARYKIVKHATTKSQVIALLGQPISKKLDGRYNEHWYYIYSRTSAQTSNWAGPKATGNVHMKKLDVVFNNKGKVLNYLYTNSTTPISASQGTVLQ